MLHRHFERLVVLGAAILFIAYAMATDDRTASKKTDKDEDASDEDEATKTITVVEAGNQAGRFGTWSLAVRQAKLVTELEGEGPFTLFAPTDEAFGTLEEKLDELLADEEQLVTVLRSHIVRGSYATADLSDGMELKTLADTTLAVSIARGRVSVGDSTVVEPDLTASNGVIHGIDKVLFSEADTSEEKGETA